VTLTLDKREGGILLIKHLQHSLGFEYATVTITGKIAVDFCVIFKGLKVNIRIKSRN
jgi:hypothetical protein